MSDINLILSIAFALKPLADIADAYDKRNTYRPDYAADEIIHSEGDVKLTLQHCFNAQKLLKELKS